MTSKNPDLFLKILKQKFPLSFAKNFFFDVSEFAVLYFCPKLHFSKDIIKDIANNRLTINSRLTRNYLLYGYILGVLMLEKNVAGVSKVEEAPLGKK